MARGVGHVVQVAFGVGLLQVHGGQGHGLLHGQQRQHRSSAPAAPSRWPCMALVALTGTCGARAPNTAFSAAVSVASLACVPVPCALTASTSKALMPARLQRRAHGAWPALHAGARDVAGVVGQAVTQHLAQDGGAARLARSQGSSTSMAAPSPSTMPLRFLETAGTTPRAQSASTAAPVCSASQALSDRWPAAPRRRRQWPRPAARLATRSQASPMATAEEEQAVE
jgi:hypothetical protein